MNNSNDFIYDTQLHTNNIINCSFGKKSDTEKYSESGNSSFSKRSEYIVPIEEKIENKNKFNEEEEKKDSKEANNNSKDLAKSNDNLDNKNKNVNIENESFQGINSVLGPKKRINQIFPSSKEHSQSSDSSQRNNNIEENLPQSTELKHDENLSFNFNLIAKTKNQRDQELSKEKNLNPIQNNNIQNQFYEEFRPLDAELDKKEEVKKNYQSSKIKTHYSNSCPFISRWQKKSFYIKNKNIFRNKLSKSAIYSEGKTLLLNSRILDEMPLGANPIYIQNKINEISLRSKSIPSRIQSFDNLLIKNNSSLYNSSKGNAFLSKEINIRKASNVSSFSDNQFQSANHNQTENYAQYFPDKNLHINAENAMINMEGRKDYDQNRKYFESLKTQSQFIYLQITKLKDSINFCRLKDQAYYVKEYGDDNYYANEESKCMNLKTKQTLCSTPSYSSESNNSNEKLSKSGSIKNTNSLSLIKIYRKVKQIDVVLTLSTTIQVGMVILLPLHYGGTINKPIIVDEILIINNHNGLMNFDTEIDDKIFKENLPENNYIEIPLEEQNPIINNQNDLMYFPQEANDNVFIENINRLYE